MRSYCILKYLGGLTPGGRCEQSSCQRVQNHKRHGAFIANPWSPDNHPWSPDNHLSYPGILCGIACSRADLCVCVCVWVCVCVCVCDVCVCMLNSDSPYVRYSLCGCCCNSVYVVGTARDVSVVMVKQTSLVRSYSYSLSYTLFWTHRLAPTISKSRSLL